MTKLKVYTITALTTGVISPEILGDAPHIRQASASVAAPSKKAAAEAFGVTLHELNRSGGETGNDNDIAVAMAEPGTVFYRSMNGGNRQSFRADGTPAVPEPTEITPTERPYFTAGEMAEALAKLPADTPLFVRGYESGVDYVTELIPCCVALFANPETYFGQHADTKHDAGDRPLDTFGYQLHGAHIQEGS